MFKRNLAITLAAVLLSAAGAAQAGSSTFPSAAPEGSETSANSMLHTAIVGLTGATSVFPSAAPEGGERNEQYASRTTPRSLERSYAGGHGGVFPSASME